MCATGNNDNRSWTRSPVFKHRSAGRGSVTVRRTNKSFLGQRDARVTGGSGTRACTSSGCCAGASGGRLRQVLARITGCTRCRGGGCSSSIATQNVLQFIWVEVVENRQVVNLDLGHWSTLKGMWAEARESGCGTVYCLPTQLGTSASLGVETEILREWNPRITGARRCRWSR